MHQVQDTVLVTHWGTFILQVDSWQTTTSTHTMSLHRQHAIQHIFCAAATNNRLHSCFQRNPFQSHHQETNSRRWPWAGCSYDIKPPRSPHPRLHYPISSISSTLFTHSRSSQQFALHVSSSSTSRPQWPGNSSTPHTWQHENWCRHHLRHKCQPVWLMPPWQTDATLSSGCRFLPQHNICPWLLWIWLVQPILEAWEVHSTFLVFSMSTHDIHGCFLSRPNLTQLPKSWSGCRLQKINPRHNFSTYDQRRVVKLPPTRSSLG